MWRWNHMHKISSMGGRVYWKKRGKNNKVISICVDRDWKSQVNYKISQTNILGWGCLASGRKFIPAFNLCPNHRDHSTILQSYHVLQFTPSYPGIMTFVTQWGWEQKRRTSLFCSSEKILSIWWIQGEELSVTMVYISLSQINHLIDNTDSTRK